MGRQSPKYPQINPATTLRITSSRKDQLDDPNGSQYNSTQEGFPLDEYKEYVEMLDDHESNDKDVVYICAVHIEENIDSDDSTIDTPAIRAIDEPEETTRVYRYRMTWLEWQNY